MKTMSVNRHFENKSDNVLLIYDKLLSELRKIGKVTESPNKSSIHLLNKYGFAGVYTRKNYILLHVHLAEILDNEKIKKVEQISKNRYIHSVILSTPADVNSELMAWLKVAWELKG